jgi:hypothetical protein
MTKPKRFFEPIRVSSGFIQWLQSMGVPLRKMEFPLYDNLVSVEPMKDHIPIEIRMAMAREKNSDEAE